MERFIRMKLLAVKAVNFASYKSIEFNYSKQGLTLISGPTGVGKSTLQDLATWTLFGVTAKGGSVDDVRSWTTNNYTQATLTLFLHNRKMSVVRIRGKSSENDLYWMEEPSGKLHRGKNIIETQQLLNERLLIDEELFIAGSYFHEFSLTSTFFNAKTKGKRTLFEKLAFLEIPILLEEKAKESIKVLKSKTQTISSTIDFHKIRLQDLLKSIEDAKSANKTWELDQKTTLDKLEKDSILWSLRSKEIVSKAEQTIKNIKEDIENINKNTCLTCGVNKSEKALSNYNYLIKDQNLLIQSRYESLNPFNPHIEKQKLRQNHYENTITESTKVLEDVSKDCEELSLQKKDTDKKLNLTIQILELSYILRSKLLKDTVYLIQSITNSYLEKYFNGEIRIEFSCKNSDTLDVTIEKNGYKCEYTQLSKGQRGILKLCFGVAVMKCITERAGTYFNTLFFDEALDGLDSDMKIKAFSLFKSLELDHESILVIDHEPGFQNMFDNEYKVTLEADCSKIEKI